VTALSLLKWLVPAVFVASAAIVHLRGRHRFRFTRQLFNHSTLLAPYNALMYAFSRVPGTPRHDVERFPELLELRRNWQVFRAEALALNDEGHIRSALDNDDVGFNSFFKTGWRRFYLTWYGRALPSAQKLCPNTVALLEGIPTIKGAMFAMLPPGAKLNPHRDPFAGSLRYHLGLVTPNSPECRIFIDGEPYFWRDGEDLVFDETFIHSAENKTDVNRIILFCDVERPLHTAVMRGINRLFSRFFVGAGAAQNLPGDPVGGINWFYSRVAHPAMARINGAAKALKKRNRTLFRVVKYTLILALVAALLYWLWR
jgi:beta-hydroxylase